MTDSAETIETIAAIDALRPLLPVNAADVERMMRPGMLAKSALWYATALGWRVFPLEVGGKRPITRRGFKDATTDAAAIRAWWEATPDANIGTPTGEAFDVVDIDAPEGFNTWAVCPFAETMPKPIAIAHTGSGGRHLLVPPQNIGNAANLGDGVDYRGRGGYIVLPPSRLVATRGIYSWLKGPS